MSKTCWFSASLFSGFGLDFGASWASKSAALLAAPGVLNPTAFYACINILHVLTRGGQDRPKTRGVLGHVGAMLAHFSLLAALFFTLGRSYAFCGHFWCILAVFCGFWNAPSSIFGGIFGHCAVISAENPAGIHLLLFVSTCSAAVRAKHMELEPSWTQNGLLTFSDLKFHF